MLSVGERNFHLVMGGVFGVAIVLENALPSVLPTWNPPRLGFLAFIAGLVWIGRYAAWRSELHDERDRVLAARVDRLERHQKSLEDELRERFRRPI
jgi:hypothetical protein